MSTERGFRTPERGPRNPAQLLLSRFQGVFRLHPDDKPNQTKDFKGHVDGFPTDGMVQYRGRTKMGITGVHDSVQRAVYELVRESKAIGFPVVRRMQGMKQTRELIDAINQLEEKHELKLTPTIYIRENPLEPKKPYIDVTLHPNEILIQNSGTALKKALEVLDELHRLIKTEAPKKR